MTEVLRLIFPNWRFFSQIGHTFEVLLTQDQGQTWDVAFPKSERSWKQLFWNPEVNLQLALYSCCEQLAIEWSETTPHPKNIQSRLQTIESLIYLKSPIHLKGYPWQFKIMILKQGENLSLAQDLFISQEYDQNWVPE